MCFSATASFTAGTILVASGAYIYKKAKNKKTKPFASIPFLFGLQQLIEGVVWLSLNNAWPIVNVFSTYGFVFFSNLLWPIYIPFAVAKIETNSWRKKAIIACGAVGVVVSFYSLASIIVHPIQSQVNCNSIHYLFTTLLPLPTAINTLFYFVATCLSCLLSQHKLIKIFGITVVTSLILTYLFFTVTLVSVWCFFSAILSLVIYFIVKQLNKN